MAAGEFESGDDLLFEGRRSHIGGGVGLAAVVATVRRPNAYSMISDLDMMACPSSSKRQAVLRDEGWRILGRNSPVSGGHHEKSDIFGVTGRPCATIVFHLRL